MRSRRFSSDHSNSGWLYADVLLALLFVFLAASAINVKGDTSKAARVLSVKGLSPDRDYVTNELVELSVSFDLPVEVSDGVLLQVETNNGKRYATYKNQTDASTLVFGFTVKDNDRSVDLDYPNSGSLITDGGSIRSKDGFDAFLELPGSGSEGSLISNSQISINKGLIENTECDNSVNRYPIKFNVQWNKSTSVEDLVTQIKRKLGDLVNKKIGVMLVFAGYGNDSQSIREAKIDSKNIIKALSGVDKFGRPSWGVFSDSELLKGTSKLHIYLERDCN